MLWLLSCNDTASWNEVSLKYWIEFSFLTQLLTSTMLTFSVPHPPLLICIYLAWTRLISRILSEMLILHTDPIYIFKMRQGIWPRAFFIGSCGLHLMEAIIQFRNKCDIWEGFDKYTVILLINFLQLKLRNNSYAKLPLPCQILTEQFSRVTYDSLGHIPILWRMKIYSLFFLNKTQSFIYIIISSVRTTSTAEQKPPPIPDQSIDLYLKNDDPFIWFLMIWHHVY